VRRLLCQVHLTRFTVNEDCLPPTTQPYFLTQSHCNSCATLCIVVCSCVCCAQWLHRAFYTTKYLELQLLPRQLKSPLNSAS